MPADHENAKSSSASPARHAFWINDWLIDPVNHTLTRGSDEEIFPAKVMGVLEYIACNHERLVTRDELIERVWDGNDYVGEKALNNAIWRIRSTLGGETGEAEIIRTVPKTGYQLLVAPVYADTDTAVAELERSPQTSLRLLTGLLLVLVVIAIVFFSRTLFEEAPELLTPRVIVDMPGRELFPSVSPDGSAVAFLSIDLANQRDIYLHWLDGQQRPLQQLTFSTRDDINPSWGPDSVHLAFMRVNPVTGACDVLVLNTHTNIQKLVANCAYEETVSLALAWSPDGKWLVIRTAESGSDPGLYLWPVNADGSARVDVAPRRISCDSCGFVDQDVSWSPDSRRLAVSRRSNRMSENVFVYDIETEAFSAATSDEQDIQGHAWFRDSERLVYVSDRGPRQRRLWLLDTLTGEKSELGIDGAGYPAFTADFESMVLHRRDANTHIASLKLGNASGPRQLLTPVIQTANAEHSPAYDPVSGRIAFLSDKSGHSEIWLAGADGSNTNQLTDMRGILLDPAWSADGTTLVFVSYLAEDRTNRIMYIDVDSGRLRTVPTGFDDHGPPTWSYDDQSLIVPVLDHGRTNLWRISLDGESRKQITSNGGEFGRENANGDVYFTRSGSDGLYRVNAEGTESLVFENFGSTSGWANWDWISENEVLYSKSDDTRMLLSRLDLRTSTSLELVEFPLRTIHRTARLSYAVAADTVYFTQRELPQIDLWIVSNPID